MMKFNPGLLALAIGAFGYSRYQRSHQKPAISTFSSSREWVDRFP